MKLSRIAVVTAVAASSLLSAAVTYAATSAAAGTPTATRTDTIVTTTSNRTLSTTGGVATKVASVRLPRGSYVLQATGDLVNFGQSDYTRCAIVAGKTQIAAISTIVGAPSGTGNQGPAGYLSPFALIGGWSNSGGARTVSLVCSHDNANGATPYVDSSATLWAHKTSSLKRASE